MRLAGEDLGVTGAVLHVKGDWMEFSVSLGLRNWRHEGCPCPFCSSGRDDLYKLAPFDPLHSPWALTNHESYEDACEMAEHHVVIDKSQHSDLCALLEYDKRPSGSKGRALMADYPALMLNKHDRLCPDYITMDVAQFDHAFDDADVKFLSCCFWRPCDGTSAKWRNPLFDASIGITVDSLAIDLLHTVHLGLEKAIVQQFYGIVL